MPRTWVGVKAMCGNPECEHYLLEQTIDLYTDTFELPDCGGCGQQLRDPEEVMEEFREAREARKAKKEGRS